MPIADERGFSINFAIEPCALELYVARRKETVQPHLLIRSVSKFPMYSIVGRFSRQNEKRRSLLVCILVIVIRSAKRC